MGISKPSFATDNRETTRYTVIRLLEVRPTEGQILPTPGVPGTLAGFYNAQRRVVELWTLSTAGNVWLRVR